MISSILYILFTGMQIEIQTSGCNLGSLWKAYLWVISLTFEPYSLISQLFKPMKSSCANQNNSQLIARGVKGHCKQEQFLNEL